MAVMLRLTRMGRKKRPFYRIVALDKRTRRDGKYIEKIGHYDPLTNPITLVVDHDAAIKWLEVGAQMSDTVKRLFTKDGVMLRWDLVKQETAQPEIEAQVQQHREKKNPQPKAKDKYVPKDPEPIEPPEPKKDKKAEAAEEPKAEEKKEEAKAEEKKEEAKAEEKADDKPAEKADAKAEEKAEEKPEEPKKEAKAEEKKEEAPAKEAAEKPKAEEKKDEAKAEEKKADGDKDEKKSE
ncbi:30S ribosomal protein S16 [bacterium]|nr:30S ribosomal protein S16 [bacterium]